MRNNLQAIFVPSITERNRFFNFSQKRIMFIQNVSPRYSLIIVYTIVIFISNK